MSKWSNRDAIRMGSTVAIVTFKALEKLMLSANCRMLNIIKKFGLAAKIGIQKNSYPTINYSLALSELFLVFMSFKIWALFIFLLFLHSFNIRRKAHYI